MSILAAIGLATVLTCLFMACFWAANHLEPEDDGRVTSRGPR